MSCRCRPTGWRALPDAALPPGRPGRRGTLSYKMQHTWRYPAVSPPCPPFASSRSGRRTGRPSRSGVAWPFHQATPGTSNRSGPSHPHAVATSTTVSVHAALMTRPPVTRSHSGPVAVVGVRGTGHPAARGRDRRTSSRSSCLCTCLSTVPPIARPSRRRSTAAPLRASRDRRSAVPPAAQQSVTEEELVHGPRSFSPPPWPSCEPGLMLLVPQQPQLSDEFTDHIRRPLRDPVLRHDRLSRRPPAMHSSTSYQSPEPRPAAHEVVGRGVARARRSDSAYAVG